MDARIETASLLKMSFFPKQTTMETAYGFGCSIKLWKLKTVSTPKYWKKTERIKLISLIACLQDNQFNKLLKLCLKNFQYAWKLVAMIFSYYRTWIKMATEAESDSRQRVSPWLLGSAGRCCGSGGLAPDFASEALCWLVFPPGLPTSSEAEPCEWEGTLGTAYL